MALGREALPVAGLGVGSLTAQNGRELTVQLGCGEERRDKCMQGDAH